MMIRFLQTVSSENPEFPFHAGQVISVACPSPYLLSLIDGEHAEALTMDDTERAVSPEVTVPEPVRKRGRRAR